MLCTLILVVLAVPVKSTAADAPSPADAFLAKPVTALPGATEQARQAVARGETLLAAEPARKTEIDAYLIPYRRVLETRPPPALPVAKPFLILRKLSGGTEAVKAQSANVQGAVLDARMPDGSPAVWQKELYLGYVPWYTDAEMDSSIGVAPADLAALAARYDAQAVAYPELRAVFGAEAARVRKADAKLKERSANRTADLEKRRAGLATGSYDPAGKYPAGELARKLLDAESLRRDEIDPVPQGKLDEEMAPYRQHFENVLAGKSYVNGSWRTREELDDTRRQADFAAAMEVRIDPVAATASELLRALALPGGILLVTLVLGICCLVGRRSASVRFCGLLFFAGPVVFLGYLYTGITQRAGAPPARGFTAEETGRVGRLLFATAGAATPAASETSISEGELNSFLREHLHFNFGGERSGSGGLQRKGWQVRLDPETTALIEEDEGPIGSYPVEYLLSIDGAGTLRCREVRLGRLTAPSALAKLLWDNLSAQLHRTEQADKLLALYPYRAVAPGTIRLATKTVPTGTDLAAAVATTATPPRPTPSYFGSTPAPEPAAPKDPAPATVTVAPVTPPETDVVFPDRPLSDAEMRNSHGFSNTMSDTWAATDNLGRAVANARVAGPPQPKRAVGIFYFLWHKNIPKIFDVTKLLAASPNPTWGPKISHHWWGEPYYGYYQADDPWVIRKHAQMLSDAGVDVIVFDSTNAHTFKDTITTMGEVYTQMRKEGCQTPQLAFMLNSKTDKTSQDLYDELYGPKRFPDLWYRWQDKPLLMAQPEQVPDAIRGFFTIKRSWAWTNPKGWFGDGKDKWPWLDNFPQNYGWSDNKNVPEELSMCVAQHPTGNYGRSHLNGKEPPEAQQEPAKGIAFAEQFKQVMKVKPEFLFITGWNEWHASRFIKDEKSPASQFMGKPLKMGDSFWVDQFSQEFSRDIEPQRGHFEDNYYYQMASYIRQYKGVRPVPRPSAPKIIGGFGDWKDVGPDYLDDAGDTGARNFPGCGEEGVYTNTEGRNDIVRAKVARNLTTVWFYAETRKDLTSPEGKNWMQLLLNIDSNTATGWFGYDYVLNRQPGSSSSAVLEHYDTAKKAWQTVARVPLQVRGNQMYVGIPRSSVPELRGQLKFEFKWADNVPLDELTSPAGFMDHGDVAPNARFNYVFNDQD